MTLPYRGSARFPGPLGTSQGTLGGRVPGPLGFRQVDLANKGATKSSKTLIMPPPWSSSNIRVREVDWKLSNGVPVTGDVMQGALPNCPVAAILAALAHTATGQKHIDGMVTAYIGAAVKTTLSNAIITTVSAETADDPDYQPQVKDIISNRYFTVTLWKEALKETLEVHDTFYAEYADNAYLKLVYMSSPNQVLWPCVIEKACALLFGSYKEIGNYKKHTANEFWEVLVGSKPQGFKVTDATDIEKIREAARGAPKIPTMGASRDDAKKVTGWHGYAVLGIQDSAIALYDPAKAKKFTMSFEDFRSNFQVLLFGNP